MRENAFSIIIILYFSFPMQHKYDMHAVERNAIAPKVQIIANDLVLSASEGSRDAAVSRQGARAMVTKRGLEHRHKEQCENDDEKCNIISCYFVFDQTLSIHASAIPPFTSATLMFDDSWDGSTHPSFRYPCQFLQFRFALKFISFNSYKCIFFWFNFLSIYIVHINYFIFIIFKHIYHNNLLYLSILHIPFHAIRYETLFSSHSMDVHT